MSDSTLFLGRAPVRVDPAGGGTDAPPFCVEHGGAVVNIAVAQHVYARLDVHPDAPAVTLSSDGMDDTETYASIEAIDPFKSKLVLLAGIVKRIAPPWGFDLRVSSVIPPGSGLGSSGAVGVACIKAFDRALEVERRQKETAELGNAIEREDLGMAGGKQDSYGAALGGIKHLTYVKGGRTTVKQLKLPPGVCYELERRCVLVYTGEVHLSGSIHADIKHSYALPDSPTVDAMKHLARIANASSTALQAGEVDHFGELLSENWTHHKRLHESCSSAGLEQYYAATRDLVVGGKTCGAGGGGCVLFLARDGRTRELEQACVRLGGKIIPFGIDDEGVVGWQV